MTSSFLCKAIVFSSLALFANASCAGCQQTLMERNLQTGSGSWENVFTEDFEHAGGASNVGPNFMLPATGDDVTKIIWNSAHSGTRVIKLRDDSGPESVLESRSIDVSTFQRIEFKFWFLDFNMRDDQYFMVEFQYNDGGQWYPAAKLVAGVDFENNVWTEQCLQWMLYAGQDVDIDTLKIRFQTFGEDNTDNIFIDDVVMNGMLKNGMPTDPPTPPPTDLPDNQCTETSDDWLNILTGDFEVAGGNLFIGNDFEDLIDGGDAQKLVGWGPDGSKAVRLRENTATSNIVTKDVNIEAFTRVEGTFKFKFDGMEANEATTDDPDNLWVEYQMDGGTWMGAINLIMDGTTYANGIWYDACFQLDVPENTSTMKLRFVAGGDTGHTDFISLDDIILDGKTPAPQYECTADSSSWTTVFTESFEHGGGPSNIGPVFYFGGAAGDDDSVKVATNTAGVGDTTHTGTRSIRLKDATDASRIYTLGQNVASASQVELTFWFKFRGMEELDNVFVEYMVNGQSSWTQASDIIKIGDNYLNDVWYQHCIQIDLPGGTTTIAFQVRADGDEQGNFDIIFVDDFELKKSN